jgi:rhodanese-related sulfurtransferase
MKRLLFILFLIPAFFLLPSQAHAQDSLKKETISPKKFNKLSKKKNSEVIDVRSAAEYETGHIPGARQIDVEKPGFEEAVQELDRSKTYLLYCKSGRRSEKALNKMHKMGFTKVYHLKGGIQNWKGKIEQ